MFKYASKITLGITGTTFAAGVGYGWYLYQHRGHASEAHVIGSNAVAQHLLLVAIAVAVVAISLFYHAKAPKKPYIVWRAPFTPEALHRVRLTILGGRQSAKATVRAVVVTLLSLIMLCAFFRAGMQIFASADPNFVVNAWGGPSRLGASFYHWLDCAVLFYITAGITALYAVDLPARKKGKAARHKKRAK